MPPCSGPPVAGCGLAARAPQAQPASRAADRAGTRGESSRTIHRSIRADRSSIARRSSSVLGIYGMCGVSQRFSRSSMPKPPGRHSAVDFGKVQASIFHRQEQGCPGASIGSAGLRNLDLARIPRRRRTVRPRPSLIVGHLLLALFLVRGVVQQFTERRLVGDTNLHQPALAVGVFRQSFQLVGQGAVHFDDLAGNGAV